MGAPAAKRDVAVTRSFTPRSTSTLAVLISMASKPGCGGFAADGSKRLDVGLYRVHCSMIPQRWIEAYLRFLLRHRTVVTLVVALVTALFAWSLKDLRVRPDFLDFYPRHHPYIEFTNEFRRMFGSVNVMSVILEVQHGDIYTPETLQKLDRITKFMIFTKGVVPYQITSIAHPKVKTVTVTQGAINAREIFYPKVPNTQEDAERVRRAVHSSRAVYGVYTSEDDTAAVVHTAFWEEALDFDYLYARMTELQRTEEDVNHRIYITGFPWLYTSLLRYVPQFYGIFACTIGALAFLLFAYFRTWTGIWVPLFSGLLSGVWGLAIATLLGFNLDPLVLVIPVFLTARALSHSVQSMDRYHEEFYRLGDQQQAIVVSYSHLFPPAIASILADGLALLVVAVAPIPLVQKVAIFASFWIVSMFISVVTLHPIILSYISPPRRPRRLDDARRIGRRPAVATAIVGALAGAAIIASGYDLVSALWASLLVAPALAWYWVSYSEVVYDTITRLVVRSTDGARRWAVVMLTVGLYLLLPLWGWQLKVGDMTPGAALLFRDHPYNVAYTKLNEKFLGASQLVVMADTLRPDGVKNDESLRVIEEFADHMEAATGARATISIVDVVTQAARLWRDGDPKWGIIPGNLRERTELLFAFESAGAGDVGMFVDRTARYATVITLFHEHSHDVIRDAIDWAKRFDTGGSLVRFRYAGGLFGILAAVNESVESSYWLNLLMIFAIVSVCLYLTYGSWFAAAILMIPVVLSQLAAEAMMVVMHIDLNVNSLPVAAAGAGVGVDYGIYHFSRMIDAYAEVGQLDEAVDYATATTGKAIIFTASTMIAGTVFWWFSDLKFQAEMGLLLALLMAFNTFGGLVVVPAFVKVLRPGFLTAAR